MKFDRYSVELTLLRQMLATNPCDPNVHDKHIINRQRALILEKSEVNSQINKYLGALMISDEREDKEIDKIFASIEKLTGIKLTTEERQLALAGKLDSLKETFKELESVGSTIFFWDNEKNLPCIGDHMIYGFLKAAGEAICRAAGDISKKERDGTLLKSISYTAKIINQHVRCEEEFINFDKDIKLNEDGSVFFFQRALRIKQGMDERIALSKSEVMEKGAKLKFTLRVIEGSPLNEDYLKELFEYGQYFTGLGQWRNAGHGMFKAEIKKLPLGIKILEKK